MVEPMLDATKHFNEYLSHGLLVITQAIPQFTKVRAWPGLRVCTTSP
jgi:hypothetical protein